jgi:hypothetical protein
MAEAQPYDVPKQVVWDAVGLDWKSRMRRESHVRFREGLGVKFPRATRLVPLGERHLRAVVREFVEHHHAERNHQGLGNVIPFPSCDSASPVGRIGRRERLGGVLSFYERNAA